MSGMRYRQLGSSGLTVSVVGLGCNNLGGRLDLAASQAVLSASIDCGITFLDTADVYGDGNGGSEEVMGRLLEGRRDAVVIATKFGLPMRDATAEARCSRRYVLRAVEGSLRRLRTDHVDLYQMHIPDGVTPVDETLGVLDELVRAGKVRYAGASNYAGWQLADADWTARTSGLTRFVSVQNHYSLLERNSEAEVIPACARFGIGMLPYFPLANGLLTGKYRRDQAAPEGSRLAADPDRYAGLLTATTFDRIEALESIARERGRSLLDVAIGGLAAQPQVASVIAGATRPEQVRANAAAGAWEPSPDDLAAIDAAAPRPAG